MNDKIIKIAEKIMKVAKYSKGQYVILTGRYTSSGTRELGIIERDDDTDDEKLLVTYLEEHKRPTVKIDRHAIENVVKPYMNWHGKSVESYK